VQVFFFFSGHGAPGSGNDLLLYSNDEKAISFYDLFHAHVTSTGAPVIAILDCCRVKEESKAQKLAHILPARTATDVCIPWLTMSFLSQVFVS
jgi:hypothetical protein